MRVSVVGGGNSGLQYYLDFDPEVRPDDVVIDLPGGRRLAIDAWSAELMAGVTIDAVPIEGSPDKTLGFWFRSES